MKQIIHGMLVAGCIMAVYGCNKGSNSTNDMPESGPDMGGQQESASMEAPADAFEFTGTVVYMDLEGGFYAIDADDGNKYDPLNLPEAFRKEGMRVKVSAQHQTDIMSIHGYGTIIKILAIDEIE
jgi:hypothetical protein